MLFMAVASLIRMVFVTINLCAASLAASSRCSPALARLCQGERLSELLTSRTLCVFDSKGDGPAKDRERFGHVRDRPSCVGRKAPLAQRCIFLKQYHEGPVKIGHRRPPGHVLSHRVSTPRRRRRETKVTDAPEQGQKDE